jgi:glycosyltransferase involved in cell wall biosynthesis
MTPSVSIVLPVYNAGAYLSSALESVLTATSKDVELIVVDDGSSDESRATLQRLSHPFVTVIRQDNGGLTQALKTGISASRSPFIARMDHDDISHPGRIETALDILSNDTRVGLVSCWAEIMNENDEVVGFLDFPWLAHDVTRTLLYSVNNVVHGAAVFRRTAYEAVGGYRTVPAEDYDLWMRIASSWDVRIVPERLYRYRVSMNSMTGRDGHALADAGKALVSLNWKKPELLHIPSVREARRHSRIYGRVPDSLVAKTYRNSLVRFAQENQERRNWTRAARFGLAALAAS